MPWLNIAAQVLFAAGLLAIWVACWVGLPT